MSKPDSGVPVTFNLAELEALRDFVAIDAKLATAGQPRADEFPLIRDAGCDAIINLALPTSTHALPNERELVAATGMHYAHIPVVWEKPTRDNLDEFFDCVAKLRSRNLLVHCALNMRASAFVFLYRTVREQVAIAEARDRVRDVWEPDDVWRDFINAQLARFGFTSAF